MAPKLHLHLPWSVLPAPPLLVTEHIHVWFVNLSTTTLAQGHLLNLLNADERERAFRFIFEKDQNQFIVARGCLRQLLSYYTGYPANELAFHEGEHGKPTLDATLHSRLHFNVSHSHGYALYGFCLNEELGIDLEAIRPTTDVAAIAKRFFSPRETQALLTSSSEAQRKLFFTYWTRKEAYLKAIGKGLTAPLNHFDVSHIATEGFVHENRPMGAVPTSWYLKDLHLGNSFKAAIALQGKNWNLHCAIWNPELDNAQ